MYVTLGTFSNNPDVFRLILHALADEPVSVVATIGRDNDPEALGPLPANARVDRFIPQADLFPQCAAVIHHAGAGTTFGVLAHGVPSVALSQSADNFTIAGRLTTAGASVTLMPDDVTSDAIVAALRRVLTEPSYRQAAERLAEEIAAMPSPAD
ncbi:MAG: glycosyltransferase, partial [Acidimicrobiia bacterium]|nr:glycosyltransferase [Acidimicrobiia bacterium]